MVFVHLPSAETLFLQMGNASQRCNNARQFHTVIVRTPKVFVIVIVSDWLKLLSYVADDIMEKRTREKNKERGVCLIAK